MSYNEDQQKVGTIKHIFLPSTTGIITELVLAALFLLFIGIARVGKKLQSGAAESDPVAYVTDIINQAWAVFNQFDSVQKAMVFLMWALFGMAVYVIFFKAFQFVYGTVYHIREGVEYVHEEHAQGMVKWLGSLHDIIFRLLLWVGGSVAIFLGIVVCFSFAIGKLEVAIASGIANGLVSFGAAYIGALLGLRLVMIGLCFLLPSFRRLYAV